MIVTIEPKARPCPGVERAISMAEDALRHGETVYSIGELIHNTREIERLEKLGLVQIQNQVLDQAEKLRKKYAGSDFLVRAHGERQSVIDQARECGLNPINATCQIVRHSQDMVEQHIRDGWRIIIVGKKEHPEVLGLLDRTNGNGSVVSSPDEASEQEFEERSLLLAQSTVDPELFSSVRRTLSKRLSDLKIMDTTCRFIRTRQKDITEFSQGQDLMLIVGGKHSSNCRLLYETARKVNPRSYHIEGPKDIDWSWFQEGDCVGISGGASTPRWQMEEVKNYLENRSQEKGPKGLKNRKGGIFTWWMKRKTPKTK
ncbi:4-hydroxy-3-methylbut-2-enyl diphosphate reductase [bacterium]|nr:4-hydroxy-3-methylbut-2-enyl diphosphate reductase [bacterium]